MFLLFQITTMGGDEDCPDGWKRQAETDLGSVVAERNLRWW